MRAAWLIARTVLIEAIRRREIYAIVAVSMLLIGAVMTVDFFQIEGLTKFYRDVALKIMSLATALTVIVLSARQLPREFESRTIYPLLAKPIGRPVFLAGKLLGVMLSAAFCFALFMTVFVAGTLYLGSSIPWGLLLQYLYLQLVMMLVLATLGFWLSMTFNMDATITMGVLFCIGSATMTSVMSFLYDYLSLAGRSAVIALNFLIPHLTLFDLSGKVVHGEAWGVLPLHVMAILTAYGLVFAGAYFALANLAFRRKPL